MKKYILLLILPLMVGAISAQGMQWSWAKSSLGTYGEEGMVVSADPVNGAFVAGYFYQDTIQFDSVLVIDTAANEYNGVIFLVNYDSSGHVKWGTNISQQQSSSTLEGGDLVGGVAADGHGGVYITGSFTGPYLRLKDYMVLNPDSNLFAVFFIARYDSLGNLAWVKVASNAAGNALCCDNQGNAYVAGYHNGPVTFGSFSLPGDQAEQITLLVKYDMLGNVIWAKGAGPVDADYAMSISYDVFKEDLFVSGYYWDSLSFENLSLARTNPNVINVYLIKLDTAGNVIWARGFSADNSAMSQYAGNDLCVAADMNGGAYLTGGFCSAYLLFGNDTIRNPNYPQITPFLLRFDASRRFKWCKVGTGGLWDIGRAVAADIWGNAYFVGSFTDPSIIIGGTTFNYVDNDELYFLKSDSNGNFACTMTLESGGDDWSALSGDRLGHMYLTGDYYAPNTTFGPFTLNTYSTTDEEIFTVRFMCESAVCNLPPVLITASDTVICSNDSVLLCGPEGYVSYLWSNGQNIPCFYTNQAGSYSVTVTNNSDCTAASNVLSVHVIAAPPMPTISIVGDTLFASGTPPWQWYFNGNPITGATGQSYIYGKQWGDYTVQVTGSNSCSSVSNPMVVSGIGQVSEDAIQIYPNPSTGKWQVATGEEFVGAELQVFDAEGRMVFRSEIQNPKFEISLGAEAGGVYMLRISAGTKVLTRKLVKM